MTINKEVLIEAILESGGAISVAAESAGCAVQTIYNHRDRDPDVAEAIETTRFNKDCRTGDLAESKLNLLIEEGYWPAIKFALSTKFKSRGYTEKTEVEHSGGEVKQVRVFMDLRPDEVDN